MIRSLARSVPFVLMAVLLTTAALARPEPDSVRLEQLAVHYDHLWQQWTGPSLDQALAAPTPEIQAILDDPGQTLLGVMEDGTPVVGVTFNANAAITTRTDRIRPGGITGYDLDGSTVMGLYLWDQGRVQDNHPEFDTRVIHRDNDFIDPSHATHVAGTMIASGVNPSAKGMAVAALLNSYGWNNDLSEMAAAGAEGALVSGHSYGLDTGSNGDYSVWSNGHDEIAVAAPHYLIVNAAGNYGWQGYQSVSDAQTGKNAICIANVDDVLDYTGPNSVELYSSSSRGPTLDGRIKPELSANGTELTSSTGTNGYSSYTGTSMSTPNTSGTAFLLYELYLQLMDELPLSSTIKALMLNTADECGPGDGPDYKFGFGLLNAQRAADLIAHNAGAGAGSIVEAELANGATDSYYFASIDDEPITATIAWIDPAAGVGTVNTLVNDLDIRLEYLGDASVYQPWVLNPSSPSSSAEPGDNIRDNVEQVDLSDPAPGQYVLRVSHKNSLQDGPQSYSLVVDGLVSGDAPQYVFNLVGDQVYVMPGGGPISYYVNFIHNGDNAVPGLVYWATVIGPGGNESNPVYTQNFTAGPYMTASVWIQQQMPGFLPGGNYEYVGHFGTGFTDPILTDSFTITKFGGPGTHATGVSNPAAFQQAEWPITARQMLEGDPRTLLGADRISE